MTHSELLILFREARQWFGDGEHADDFGRNFWTEPYRDIVDRVDAALAAAAPAPVAWLHEITEPGGVEPVRMLSFSPDNPWLHWLSEHRAQCVYRRTALGPLGPEEG